MKRLLFVLLVLLTAGMLFASGGEEKGAAASGAVQLNPPGTYPVTKAPYTVNVIGGYYAIESSGKPGDSKFNQWFEKLTNVKFNFVDCIEGNAAAEKINLILASGDLPEAFMTVNYINVQQLAQYGSQGTFVPLNKLIDKYMPGLKKDFAEYPNYAKQLTAPDGNIYAMPYLEAGCFHCSMSRKFWIYKPWLDKLGLKVPTNTDEFYNMLVAFKNKDPNGNGKADEIPLMGSTSWNANPMDFIMPAFIYRDSANYMQNDKGVVSFVANKPEWREGLKYLAKLYKEGLIAKDSFVYKEDQARAVVENPDVALVGSFPAGWYGVMTVNGAGTGRYADFQPISPIAGPTGLRQSVFNEQPCNPHTIITNKARNPEVIAQALDWFFTPPLEVKTDMPWDFSQEGVNWRYATDAEKKTLVSRDGLPAVTMPVGVQKEYGKEKYDDGWTRSQPRWGYRDFGGMPVEWQTDPAKQEWRLMVATRDLMLPFKVLKSMPPNLVFDKAIQNEFTDLRTAIASGTGVVANWSTEFVVGTRNINDDGQWQAYLAELKKAGVDRYEKIWSDTVKAAGY